MVANRLTQVEAETRRECTDTYPKTDAFLFPLTRAVLVHTDHGDVICDVHIEMCGGWVEAEVFSIRRKSRADWSRELCFSREDGRHAELSALELV